MGYDSSKKGQHIVPLRPEEDKMVEDACEAGKRRSSLNGKRVINKSRSAAGGMQRREPIVANATRGGESTRHANDACTNPKHGSNPGDQSG